MATGWHNPYMHVPRFRVRRADGGGARATGHGTCKGVARSGRGRCLTDRAVMAARLVPNARVQRGSR